ncbi:hypothetical protein FSP39_020574 [Pinctada imbricata]|uniref:NEDD4-binding protein 2 n=1 Tax=Pinctada imbricata TaxID=66713 RepID=A0AA88YF29_PINIB|nr:hypothetical protein FSP39_020574 [Pinctada imbricata]
MRRTNQVRQMSPPRLPGRHAGGSRQQEPNTNDQLFQRVQEMFEGKVEGEVVFMVLQEFDWNVEKAVDSLSVMCGDTLDPEVKQSKLAEIAKDILLSEKKQLRYTPKASQELSASDFPALTPNNASNSGEKTLASQLLTSGPKTSEAMVLSSTSSSARSDSDRKSIDSYMPSGPSFINDEKKSIRREVMPQFNNSPSIDDINPDAIDDDYWPKLGDPSIHTQHKLVGPGVIGEKRGRSIGGNSLSPRYRSDESESRSQSSDSSKRDASHSGQTSKYDTWTQGKRPLDNENNTFPSFHSDIGKPSPNMLKSNPKLQSSFDSIDDIDDDFEDELNLNVEMKQRHSSGTTTNSQSHQDAIGQSILSGALMLSDYSISNQANDNNLLPNSPIETDSCDISDLGVNKSVGESDSMSKQTASSYLDQMNLHGFWFKDEHSSPGGSSMPAQTLSPNKGNILPDNAGDRIKSPVVEVNKSSTESSSKASRYNFVTPSGGDQILNRLDSSDFDDIENLLKTFKEENYKDEKTSVNGKSKQEKGDMSETKKVGMDDQDKEMKLPVLSFELSAEAKEFIPRPKKDDSHVSEGSEGMPPKFFLPKMMRHDRPPTTSPPRMPLLPPGMPPPRPPFAMPLPRWPPPPPGNARMPFPGQMGHPPPGSMPPRPPFPGFHDHGPRGPYASMVLRPGQMLPPRRAMPRPPAEKGLTGSSSVEIERVKEKINSGKKCLIILRGLPGSGKSTLARDLEAGGCTLTTDDFFMKDGQYNYDVTKLSQGHEWNKKRASMAMEEGFTPVIIDNTNTQAWEMKPYVVLALSYGYDVEILEPNTEWKFSVKDLEKRNSHKVPRETLKKMKERYQHNVTVESILGNKYNKDSKMKKMQESTSSSPLPDSEEDFPALPKKSDKNVVPVDRKGSLEAELAFDNESKDCHTQRNVEEKRSETMYSPIPGNIVRPGKGLSPVNLHKQLEIISARKMLLSPPVSVPAKKVCNPLSQEKTAPVSTKMPTSIPSLNESNNEENDKQESEIDSMVNDLIKDQIGTSFDKNFDYTKATEELKAFLHIMPIEPDNLPVAEAVIDKKMNEIVKSLSITTAKNDESASNDDSTKNEGNKKETALENSWQSSDFKSETQSTDDGSEDAGIRKKVSQKTSENKSTCSIGSDLDLEKIEDSAILNDLDNMSSVSGEMEKLSLAAQMFEKTVRQGEVSQVKDEEGDVPKPQRERRVRNHSQPNEMKVENSKEVRIKNSVDAGHQTESNQEVEIESSTIADNESKYWGKSSKSETDETCILRNSGNGDSHNVDNTWNDPRPKREKKADVRMRRASNSATELIENSTTERLENSATELIENSAAELNENGKLNSNMEHAGSVLMKKLSDSLKDHNFPVVQRVEDLEKVLLSDMPLHKEDKIQQLIISSEDSSKTSSASISPKSLSVSPKDELENMKDNKALSNTSTPKKRKAQGVKWQQDADRTLDDVVRLPDSDQAGCRNSPEGLMLPLEIPGDFTRALISLFGPVREEFIYMADKVQIQVDFEMARRLHACLQTAEEIYVPKQNKKQLQEDEAMARKLQSEIYRQNRQPVVPSLSPIKAWSQSRSDIGSGPAVSLADIMEEQEDTERKMKELQMDVAASGTRDMLASKMKVKKLSEEFPGIDESVIYDIFQANCFSYEDTSSALRSCLDADYRPLKTFSTKSSAAKEYETNMIEAAKQQSLSEMLNSCLYQSRFQNAENPEYDDIRGEANLHYCLRHQCFQKAQDAHSKGMREVASFYARQGHLHTQKIKEANKRAAEKILAQRNQYIENSNTIDLHGLHVDEAKTILQQVIERRELELQHHPDKRKRQLFIITGRGNHSRGGIARIKPAVINFLQQGQYRFTQVHQGMLKLQLSI